MSYEIKIPSVGESVLEVTIADWCKKDGDFVDLGDVLLVLETDKASVEIEAEKSGVLKILTPKGSTVPIGSQVGILDPDAKITSQKTQETDQKKDLQKSEKTENLVVESKSEINKEKEQDREPSDALQTSVKNKDRDLLRKFSPATRHFILNQRPDIIEEIAQSGPVTKQDLKEILSISSKEKEPAQKNITPQVDADQLRTEMQPLSAIRRTIARRLKEVQNTAAILTTFNEVDLTETMQLRQKYQEQFVQKHGVKLGLMSLFIKACIEGLKAYPLLNGLIKDNHLVYNHFYNIGVAVSTPRGLMVPVLRDADHKSLAQIETEIKEFAQNARKGKVSIDDLSGGTFSVTNGGVFGSMLSTPILNPPQSGILGMHAIIDRPMVIDGQIKIRKMMYVALSYDHRIVDGREAVSFLVMVKQHLEDVRRLLLQI